MHAFDRQTDRQTDRRTDGRTDRIPIAIPRLHSMQRGKNQPSHYAPPRGNVVGQGAETPYRIVMKFCTVVEVPDFITHAKFSDNRLRGFGDSGGQISKSSIDFH